MSMTQGLFPGPSYRSVREHWLLFLIEGLVLVVLGVLAMLVPPIASLAATILFGWILLVSGSVGLFTTFWGRQLPGFWWSLISAVLGIAAGAILLVWPLNGIYALTLLLIAFFFVEGVVSIMFAIEHSRQLSGRWGWMLASGIMDVILAVVVYLGLPWSAFWALGILLGINLIFGGVSLTAMALHARSSVPPGTAL